MSDREVTIAIKELIDMLRQYERDLIYRPEGKNLQASLDRVRATITKMGELA